MSRYKDIDFCTKIIKKEFSLISIQRVCGEDENTLMPIKRRS